MNEIPKYLFALREDLKDAKQFLPTRAEPNATGWDVRVAPVDRKPILLKPFQKVLIPLGFRAFCPEGWWYELKPRSSTFAKKSLHALYGTIDQTFENELLFSCQYIPYVSVKSSPFSVDNSMYTHFTNDPLTLTFGEAIGQIIPVRRKEMEVVEISNEEYNSRSQERDAIRKEGGFGSTG